MELVLWRHAEAEDGSPDTGRQLTSKGEKQASKIAGFLRPRLPEDTLILVSPAIRAQQTAQALTKHFITEARIAPGASPQAILKAANWGENKGSVLVVGHQPTLGSAVALLMMGKPECWGVKKGGVWWLTTRDREIIVRLVISPDLI